MTAPSDALDTSRAYLASAAAGATRDVGDKIGSKLPPDPNKP